MISLPTTRSVNASWMGFRAHAARLRTLLLLAGGLGTLAEGAAQGPRLGVIAPPDLWIRADIEREWGEAIVLRLCPDGATLESTEETLPADESGAYTRVRTFSATCACTGERAVDRQFIRVFPASPLPVTDPGSGCAPALSVSPGGNALPLGAPEFQSAQALQPSDAAWAQVRETRHLLWRDGCGRGSDWVVWEATGPCGDVARYAFEMATTAPATGFSAPPSAPAVASSQSIPIEDFEPGQWGIGPLEGGGTRWNGMKPVERYRTWAAPLTSGHGGTFATVEIGCGQMQIVGSEEVAITGNYPPRLRFEPEVEITCGLDRLEWPEVRARDRQLETFGGPQETLDLPVEETVDTLWGDCPGRFMIQRHLRAIDADGAEVSAVQTLHVNDITPPQFYNSPAEWVGSEGVWPPAGPTAFATETCAGEVTLVWADSTDCVTGRIHRIHTATDGCGNASTLRQVLIPPTSVVVAPPVVLAVGCADPAAMNYTGATCFLSSQCLYADAPHCVGDLDENGMVSTGDLLMLLGIFGTTCPAP